MLQHIRYIPKLQLPGWLLLIQTTFQFVFTFSRLKSTESTAHLFGACHVKKIEKQTPICLLRILINTTAFIVSIKCSYGHGQWFKCAEAIQFHGLLSFGAIKYRSCLETGILFVVTPLFYSLCFMLVSLRYCVIGVSSWTSIHMRWRGWGEEKQYVSHEAYFTLQRARGHTDRRGHLVAMYFSKTVSSYQGLLLVSEKFQLVSYYKYLF